VRIRFENIRYFEMGTRFLYLEYRIMAAMGKQSKVLRKLRGYNCAMDQVAQVNAVTFGQC
jgi:hypothetical protein